MKRVAIVLTAAALSGIGIGTVNAADKANNPTTAPSPMHVVNGAANLAPSAKHVSGKATADSHIRDLFRNLTNDALTARDMGQLISLFDKSSQQRITRSDTYNQSYGSKLDAQIEAVSKNWKQQYGHKFAVMKAGGAFGSSFATLQEGTPGGDNDLSSEVMIAAGEESNGTKPLMVNKAIALADIKAGKTLPDLRVPLVCEGTGDWKIDAPNSLTASKLRENLLAELTIVNNYSAHWPANETDAYRLISHHILLAVMDKPALVSNQAKVPEKKDSAVVVQTPTNAKPLQTTVKPSSATNNGTSHSWWKFWNW